MASSNEGSFSLTSSVQEEHVILNEITYRVSAKYCFLIGNDQNKPYGLLSDPTSMILYLCKSD